MSGKKEENKHYSENLIYITIGVYIHNNIHT